MNDLDPPGIKWNTCEPDFMSYAYQSYDKTKSHDFKIIQKCKNACNSRQNDKI